MEGGTAVSSKRRQKKKKQLIFDHRYGWVYDDWRDPGEVALVGGRGMFCVVPLTKATVNLVFQQARPPILSKQSLLQYKKLPGRLLLPWRIFPRHGTIAADTDFYPFGTRMFVPGYGWGEVEDRGAAIKGPGNIDLYHCSHTEALKWGRRKLQVLVVLPGQSTLDSLKIPRPVKDVLKGLNWLRGLIF